MKRLKYYIVIIIVMLFSQVLRAAWQMPIANYNKSEYNAGTQNWAIGMNSHNWLYFANNYGLLEYDGISWRLYGIWHSSPVRSLSVRDNGDVYVGGVGEFGVFKHDDLGNLEYHSLSHNMLDSIGNIGDIWGVFFDKGSLWLQTRDAVYVVDEKGELKSVYRWNGLVMAAELVDGTLYVVTGEGLFVCKMGGVAKKVPGTEFLSQRDVRNIKYLGSKRFIISTQFEGLYIYDGNTIVPFKTDVDSFIKENMLYTIALNSDNIAIGTVSGGVVVVDKLGRNPRYVSTLTGMQNNTVLSLMFDKSNDLWCGLDQGIDKVSVSSPVTNLYSRASFYGSGYAQAVYDGKLYFGTNRGLYYSEYPFDDMSLSLDAHVVEGSLGQVWNLQVVGGKLYCCHDKGLYRVEQDKLVEVVRDEGFWQIRELPMNKQYVVAGSYDGFYLMKYEGDMLSVMWKIAGVKVSAKSFEVDNNNRIWVVTDKGVERITLNGAMTEGSLEVVLAHPGGEVYHNVLKIGEQIVVSQGGRSYITNEHNNLAESVGKMALLDGNEVFYNNIEVDDDGNIWYIVGDLLKVCRRDSLTGRYADRAELVWNMSESLVYGFSHLLTLDRENVIVGTLDGFIKGNAEKARHMAQSFKPKTFLRQIKSVSKSDEHVIYDYNVGTLDKPIEIPYKHNSLVFVYGCSQCYDKKEVYRYALTYDGDVEFSEWIAKQDKEFTFLEAGEYEFRVKARTQSGVIADECVVYFTILPPWYKTWWAYLIWGFVMVSVVAVLLYILHRRNRLMQMRLVEQNEVKLREQERLHAQQSLEQDKAILQLQNEKIESELKSKSEELSNILLNNINRNELITKVRHDLMKITEDLNEKDVKSALKRISMMQSRLITDGEQKLNWERFEENFDIVNDKFLKRLQERFPWISDSEKRLCVYIRMGLLNKEMAPLMNITIRGVEMIRYRMRKKMELTRDDDLDSFLSQLL